MCGADGGNRCRSRHHLGSPPRVRSRRTTVPRPPSAPGITSACAEQTRHEQGYGKHGKDHLRVCGADPMRQPSIRPRKGSPPRVRSRPSVKTKRWSSRTDHLRVCGADRSRHPTRHRTHGSPPRVRSRPIPNAWNGAVFRITSACAEQTASGTAAASSAQDHLRVCGADAHGVGRQGPCAGSPPRVRSRRSDRSGSGSTRRITSACAEQTSSSRSNRMMSGDHLRVCGADSCILLCSEPAEWRGIFDLRTA